MDRGRTMTGRMVERAASAAYRATPVRPDGARSLMPPQSQGAERRTAHRAGHSGARRGLRALVIGGLAGAAWLLTGAAAHAADRDPTAGGISLDASLIGSVLPGDDHSIPVVDRVLNAAAQPLAPVHHPISSTAQELTAPLRPAGVAVDTREPVQVSDDMHEPEPSPATTYRAPDRSDVEPAAAGKTDAAQVRRVVDRDSTPGGDRPAPLQVHLGAANGVPASGPGPATDGDSAAFLPD